MKESMKKIFIVAGELSGDKLGAWYISKLNDLYSGAGLTSGENFCFEAVGGKFLENAGSKIYARFEEKLNIVGVTEIIKKIPAVLKFIKQLSNHIIKNDFDEVVVIDVPGFNLRLIKKLKHLKPDLKITYLSPPQLWVWGERRVKKIKKFCDEVIVIYPFEVDWYKQRSVSVTWLGYPFYNKFKPYFDLECKRRNRIAVMLGSRRTEVDTLLPIFSSVIKKFKLIYPYTEFVFPIAESVDKKFIENRLKKNGLNLSGNDIKIIQGEDEKFKALKTCCLALTKPGTVSLELALLAIPAIVAYKVSWITYFIAKLVVKIKHMALPNLIFGNSSIYPEFIQGDCKVDKILSELNSIYCKFIKQDKLYFEKVKNLEVARNQLSF